VHFAGQPGNKEDGVRFFRKRGCELNDVLSHSCLSLLAIRVEPVQTPFASAVTQLPLDLYEPEAQTKQLFDVGPEHVEHDGEQTLQAVPLLKLPVGHAVPVDVTAWGAIHFVRSLASRVKPDWQVIQVPVPSAHWAQPSSQTVTVR
jgi:hypothetical protein